MNCLPDTPKFRLLNHLVGWDENDREGLVGINSAQGVQLKPLEGSHLVIEESTLSMWLPPAHLAKTCGVCQWFLITPCPPQSRLLVADACEPRWTEPMPGAHGVLQCARAIAVSPRRIAITDTAAKSVFYFTDKGRRQLGRVPFDQPGAIAHASWREWLVVDESAGILRRLDMAGVDVGVLSAPLPAPSEGHVDRLAVDDQCRVWIALKQHDGRYTLWRAGRHDNAFKQTDVIELQRAFDSTGLSSVSQQGFCFDHAMGSSGLDVDVEPHKNQGYGPCFSWYGRPLDTLPAKISLPTRVERGQLLTTAIDSGIPRCRWHRVRIDADMPQGTTVALAVSTSEASRPDPQGVAQTGEWSGFQAGLPHPKDWQDAPLNGVDFLIQQPPGRYLFLRLRLTGDGFKTPSVTRIRLDFPRRTSLDQLPFVYRENPEAEDFGERFLSLFDAFLENADEVIERLPALLDTGGVPDAVLPWLGRFLDIVMDPAWDTERRRRILQAAPKLYRMRGTVDGMRVAIQLVFDVDPVIVEWPVQRPYGAVGNVRLTGGTRLFGPSRWRFRLDRSRLSQAPLRSFGNPDRDPFNALAHRFTVMVPLVLDQPTRSRVQRLIDAQKPAHTVATLHDGNGAFILGARINLGINTAFRPFAPSVLSDDEQGVRLNRGSILSSAPAGSDEGLRVGLDTIVGAMRSLG